MKNRTIIGIVCIVMALVVTFGVAPLVNEMADNRTDIVRMKKNVDQGHLISEDDIEVVSVISEAIRFCSEDIVKAWDKRLSEQVYTEDHTQFSVYKDAYQNEYGEIEGYHQYRPAYSVCKQVVGDGSKSAYASRGEAVTVLEKMVCRTDDDSRHYGIENVEDGGFYGVLGVHGDS